jgi:predicted permease
MGWLRQIVVRVRAAFGKSRKDRVLDEELQIHLAFLTEQNIERGMSPEAARRAAKLSLGGADQIKESVHDHRGLPLLETLWQDVRYSFRQLRRSPGFAAVAIITLGLGIGANAAVFSVVDAIVLRPLPYPQQQRLVQIIATEGRGGTNETRASYAAFMDWRNENRAFVDLAAYQETVLTLTGHGQPELVNGLTATPSLFSMLGVRPLLGRIFDWQDEKSGSAPVALIGENLWRSRYASNPRVVGETVKLNDKAFTVVGVLSSRFRFPFGQRQTEVWVPVTQDPTFGVLAVLRAAHYLDVVACLKPRVTLVQAEAQMSTILQRLAATYPKTDSGWAIRIVPLKEKLVGQLESPLFILLGAVGLVLLTACVNVANVLLARATTRSREMSIRAALGASGSRLARQVLTETIVLSLLAGALGLLLAALSMGLLRSLLPATVPQIHAIQVDGWVLGFTIGASVLVGLLSGSALALHQRGSHPNDALKEGGRGGLASGRNSRTRNFLVMAELALALVVLAGAGLLFRSLLGLERVPLGFNPHHVVELKLELPQDQYKVPEQWRQFYAELLARIRALPGVTDVGAALAPPLSGVNLEMKIAVQGRPTLPAEELPSADYSAVSADYFRTLHIPLTSGRFFTEADAATSSPVVIINKTLAADYFDKQDPIGQSIKINYPSLDTQARRIVGVVGDVRSRGPNQEPPPAFFTPFTQTGWWVMAILIRTTADPTLVVNEVRSQVEQMDGSLALGSTDTMEHDVRESMAQSRLYATLLGTFAGLTLILAAVGVYGVISYSVRQRTHEIGIRVALGAQPRDVMRLILGQGALFALVGVAVGLLAAFALTRLMASLLYGISSSDPLTFAAVSTVLLAVSLLAAYVPARRAMRVDPMVALRYE